VAHLLADGQALQDGEHDAVPKVAADCRDVAAGTSVALVRYYDRYYLATEGVAMTMTVKLDPEMEQRLRQRSAALRKPASALIREALADFLATDAPGEMSAFALGADLFGRHRGPADLAERRKSRAAQAWAGKHRARRA
jgi:predicted DNA-binding protein